MAGGSTRVRTAAAVVIALVSVAGCGGGDSNGEGAAVPTPQGSALKESDWIATRLGLLPVPDGADEAVEVRVGDLDRVTDLVGLPRPTSMADRQALSDWQYAILGIRLPPEAGDTELRPSPAAVPNPQSAIPDQGEDDWTHGDGRRGWNLLDVGWFAEAAPLEHSPHLTAVLGGTFTAERLTSSLGGPDANVWSRDPASVGERGVLSPGTWVHAGLAGANLVVSDNPDAVRAATDRRGPTLADNDVLVEMADALDAHGAYSAVLRSRASGFPFPQRPGTDPEVVERAREADLLFPDRFTGVGVGLTADGDPLALVVYVHDDEQAAARNSDFLKATLEEGNRYDNRPWADIFTVDDVTTEGRVVTAGLRFADGRTSHIFDLPVEADPTLFTHR
jgi:hypothetical protein